MYTMDAGQIVEHARRERYRVVVTEQMVIGAVARLPAPFTCRDVAGAIPCDDKGCTVSEYLVSLWIDDLVRRHRIRWTGARRPRTYEALP